MGRSIYDVLNPPAGDHGIGSDVSVVSGSAMATTGQPEEVFAKARAVSAKLEVGKQPLFSFAWGHLDFRARVLGLLIKRGTPARVALFSSIIRWLFLEQKAKLLNG